MVALPELGVEGDENEGHLLIKPPKPESGQQIGEQRIRNIIFCRASKETL